MCILCTESRKSSCIRLYVPESKITSTQVQLSTCYRYNPAKLLVILSCRKKLLGKSALEVNIPLWTAVPLFISILRKLLSTLGHIYGECNLKKQYHGEERKIPWSYEHLVKHNCSWRGGWGVPRSQYNCNFLLILHRIALDCNFIFATKEVVVREPLFLWNCYL